MSVVGSHGSQHRPAGGVLRGAVSLSVGTAAVRGLSAASQLLLAIWLLPAEFGLWAASLSSLTFFTSVANFGEVNGYLSGRSNSFSRLVRSTRRQNAALTATAIAAGIVVLFAAGVEGGVLALIIALSIPLQGEADVYYAAGVKLRAYTRLVVAQLVAAVIKLLLGVGLAVWLESALALAVPTLLYYLIQILCLRGLRGRVAEDAIEPEPATARERFSWAVNSLVMTLPLQIGFFVAQFVTDKETLGLYYLAFQLSLGISGLLAVPLARVALSAFGEESGRGRVRLAVTLSQILGAAVTLAVATLCAAVIFFGPLVPTDWRAAAPVAVVMLASLPIRLIAPVLEGFQQSNKQWWQSTLFNAVETLASALIALSLAYVDLITFALLLTGWRLLFGVVRMVVVLRSAGWLPLTLLSLSIAISTALLSSSALSAVPYSYILLTVAAAQALVWLAMLARRALPNRIIWRKRKRDAI
ncbi:oligosaccharide flippase family protein [Microbacterium sp. 77mftsu3.1]|uniref:oligosaccharide flippase family protein n=1 Tax=Microbacterium sp. 77mftsu3.1 TaxID=1761802 RepID=UPI00037E727F|nr:oligosaccharide flippase family protein [Microbacterium sp. 77mftsu3.1]SDG71378.1 Membrane protein involved in the export of O-antigen and teichoic acid [Microbacterium sp. 77mftsu3.1]